MIKTLFNLLLLLTAISGETTASGPPPNTDQNCLSISGENCGFCWAHSQSSPKCPQPPDAKYQNLNQTFKNPIDLEKFH
jgi:hypothetical protein